MPGSEAIRELGESRVFLTTDAGQIWRSPLFVFQTHSLLFFQTWGYSRPRPVADRPPESKRLVAEVSQQVNGEWQPLHITGFGGGGSERMVHWIELELLDGSASAVRISYSDPALATVDDQIMFRS
jgi:hypothetical protein